MLSKEEALALLGLTAEPDPPQLDAALRERQSELRERRDNAPTDALRKKYQDELARLDQAFAALQDQPVVPGLSHTQFQDLPGAEPSYTIGDGGGDQPGSRLVLEAGQVLAGRYEIQERIGAGGMGAVFRAFDRNRTEDIAIKVLLPGLLQREAARERFLAEARLSSALSHPNIVNVFDVQSDGELFFLTMELLEGRTLRDEMADFEGRRKPYPVARAVEVVSELCQALSYAHERTVHRDVKPENVFLTEAGKIKLMDFGIARLLSTSQLTMTGASMGTAYYMAPEQLKGAKEVDGRADQYSLGVMLYEMLTGDVPTGRVKPVHELRRDVPKGLSVTLDRALEPRPESRFGDIGGFQSALTSKKVAKPVKSLGAPSAGSMSTGKWIAAGALAILVLGISAWTMLAEEFENELAKARVTAASALHRASQRVESYEEALEDAQDFGKRLERDVSVAKQDHRDEPDHPVVLRAERILEAFEGQVEPALGSGFKQKEAIVEALARISFLSEQLDSRDTTVQPDLVEEEAEQHQGTLDAAIEELGSTRLLPELLVREADARASMRQQLQPHTRVASSEPFARAALNALAREHDTGLEAMSRGEFGTAIEALEDLERSSTKRLELASAFEAWERARSVWEACSRADADGNLTTSEIFATGRAVMEWSQSVAVADWGQHPRELPMTVAELQQRAVLLEQTLKDGLEELVGALHEAGRPLTAEMVDVLLEAGRPLTAEMVDALQEAGSPLTAEMVIVKAKAGDRASWTNSIGVELIGLPAGSFLMGSNNGVDSERPPHDVKLTQAFLLGKTEVTQAQWKALMGNSPSSFKGNDRPVESVLWSECVEFCDKLTARERKAGTLPDGWKYSLPTEAQWEYACRADTTTAYSFGSSTSDVNDYLWWRFNSGGQTHDIGGKRANPWGFHDMHGNVSEWCSDWYGSDYYSSRSSMRDPVGPSDGSYRIIRGGSYRSVAPYLRSAYRRPGDPGYPSRDLGLRLAMVPAG